LPKKSLRVLRITGAGSTIRRLNSGFWRDDSRGASRSSWCETLTGCA
jgi:hypothetical protein